MSSVLRLFLVLPLLSTAFLFAPSSFGDNKVQDKQFFVIYHPKMIGELNQGFALIQQYYMAGNYQMALLNLSELEKQVQNISLNTQNSGFLSPDRAMWVLNQLNSFKNEIKFPDPCDSAEAGRCNLNENQILKDTKNQILKWAKVPFNPNSGATFPQESLNIPTSPVTKPSQPFPNLGQQLPNQPTPNTGQTDNPGGGMFFPQPINPGTGPIVIGPGTGGPGQPNWPVHPGFQFPNQTPHDPPFPLLGTGAEGLLNLMGLTTRKYSEENALLRAEFGFPANDYLADVIINRTVTYTSGITLGTNAFMWVPIAGVASSIAIFPLDLWEYVRANVGMMIQINDLYSGGLPPEEIKNKAKVYLLMMFSTKALMNFHKTIEGTKVAAGGLKSGWQQGVGMINAFGTGLKQRWVGTASKELANVGSQIILNPATGKATKEASAKAVHGLFKQYNAWLAAKTAAIVAGGAWGGFAGLGVAGGLAIWTGTWTFTSGMVAKFISSNMVQHERSLKIDNFARLLQNQELAASFISLLVESTKVSSKDPTGGEDVEKLAHYVLANIGIHPDADENLKSFLYQFYLAEKSSMGTLLPIEQQNALAKENISHRVLIAELIQNQQMLGHIITPEEKKFFDGVVRHRLGLNTSVNQLKYTEYFKNRQNFIYNQNLGLVENEEAFAGYAISLLENPDPYFPSGDPLEEPLDCKSNDQAPRCGKRQMPIGFQEKNVPGVLERFYQGMKRAFGVDIRRDDTLYWSN